MPTLHFIQSYSKLKIAPILWLLFFKGYKSKKPDAEQSISGFITFYWCAVRFCTYYYF